jgi:hypothetical protein
MISSNVNVSIWSGRNARWFGQCLRNCDGISRRKSGGCSSCRFTGSKVSEATIPPELMTCLLLLADAATLTGSTQRRDGSFVAPNVVFCRTPTTLQKQLGGRAQKLFFEAHQICNSTAKKGRMLLPLGCGKRRKRCVLAFHSWEDFQGRAKHWCFPSRNEIIP